MRVYLDHNGTTPLRPEVRERYLELLDAPLGNPSATHASGRRARAVVDEARAEVAAALDIPEEWVVFTSGGTEANNTALRGVLGRRAPGAALVVGATEHSSVLETARELEAAGARLALTPVAPTGALDLAVLAEQLEAHEPALVSFMVANNETGAGAPMEALGALLGPPGPGRPVWHCDAVQALGKLPLDLAGWGVDLASLSAHKVGGPVGVGMLIRRPGVDVAPLLTGGGQEVGARSGTESAAAIGAAALAVRLAVEEREAFGRRAAELVEALWRGIQDLRPDARRVGPAPGDEGRLPNTLCVLLRGVDGRGLLARLDLEGLEASQGSACSSGAIEPSHVLLAMGLDDGAARSALRLSVGRSTTHNDVHIAVEKLGKALQGSAAPS